MTDDPLPDRLDNGLRSSLVEWLEKAREFLTFVRERAGAEEQQQEVLAEIEFYEWLLALCDSGDATGDPKPRPSYPAFRTALDALDHTITRSRERAAAAREQGDVANADAEDARKSRVESIRRQVEAIQPAEGTVEPYLRWYEAHP